MEPAIDVTFRETAPLPRVEAAMRARALDVARRFDGLRGVHIVVETEGNRFLTGHDYIVAATLTLDGETLVVGQHKRHPDLASAIECTFASIAAKLETRAAASGSRTTA